MGPRRQHELLGVEELRPSGLKQSAPNLDALMDDAAAAQAISQTDFCFKFVYIFYY